MKLEDYIGLALQVIQNSIPAERGFMTAATLGSRLRDSISDEVWTDFGYRTLTDFLQALEKQQLIVVFRTPKDALAVRLPGATPSHVLTGLGKSKYNPLRKPLWSAFVVAVPAGRRFLNRRNGSVRLGLQASPSPIDEWVEVQQIPSDVQVGWAREFLNNADLADQAAVLEALGDPYWYQIFPRELDNKDRSLRPRWNKFRSAKVSAHAEAWAKENEVSLDLVFQGAEPEPFGNKAEDKLLPTSAKPGADRRREWILAALNALPLEKLLEIPLPAGLLFEAMDTDATSRR